MTCSTHKCALFAIGLCGFLYPQDDLDNFPTLGRKLIAGIEKHWIAFKTAICTMIIMHGPPTMACVHLCVFVLNHFFICLQTLFIMSICVDCTLVQYLIHTHYDVLHMDIYASIFLCHIQPNRKIWLLISKIGIIIMK